MERARSILGTWPGLASSPGRRLFWEIVALVLIAALPLFFFAWFWNSPFERDEGAYATVANGILNGKVPYRDLFDNKPPLVYIWYVLSFLTFGEGVASPRIVAAILLSLTTVAVYVETRLLFASGAGLMAAACFALSTGVPFVGLHANTESFMLLPLVASLLALTMGFRRRRQLWWFGLAGVLAGMALLTKQVAVWNLLALTLVATLWRWDTVRSWSAVVPGSCVVAGACLALGLAALPFALNGALGDFLYANTIYNFRYLSVFSSGQRDFILERGLIFGAFFFALAGPLVVGATCGLVTQLRSNKSWAYHAFAAWVGAGALGVVTGGRFYPHYFSQIMPALAILTAVFVHQQLRNRGLRPVPALALLVAGVSISLSVTTNALLYVVPDRTQAAFSRSGYQQKEWEKVSEKVAAYIALHTDPEDRVFNYGREPQIYFYADRSPASQYFYDWVYSYDPSTVTSTVDQLRQDPPKYIVDSVQPPLFSQADREPELDTLLAESYQFVDTVEFAKIYRLRP